MPAFSDASRAGCLHLWCPVWLGQQLVAESEVLRGFEANRMKRKEDRVLREAACHRQGRMPLCDRGLWWLMFGLARASHQVVVILACFRV